MSYTFHLNCGCCENTIKDWNYTYNIAPMIYVALGDDSFHWTDNLDGFSGHDASFFLDRLIDGMEEREDECRAMNPTNNWGDYDSFLAMLKEMAKYSRLYSEAAVWQVL